jgi:hypothetical protein
MIVEHTIWDKMDGVSGATKSEAFTITFTQSTEPDTSGDLVINVLRNPNHSQYEQIGQSEPKSQVGCIPCPHRFIGASMALAGDKWPTDEEGSEQALLAYIHEAIEDHLRYCVAQDITDEVLR